MTAPTIADGQNVSRESFSRLEDYVALLREWQQRINLIGPSTVEQIWTRHVADALQVRSLLPPGTASIADLGSGAGIPGLVLAIDTGLSAELFESNGKKAAFLGEAIRRFGLNCRVHQERIESLATVPSVDVVLARGLAPLPRLLDLAAPFLSAGAVGLFHKGKDVDAELTAARKSWKLDIRKHPSQTDSHGVILEVKGALRVKN